jgi:biopolymer transport protein ExbD
VIRFLRGIAPVLALVAVFTLTSAAIGAEAKGKIKSVAADKNEFVMTDDTGKSWTIMVARDGKVQLNAKDSKLADLQADDEIQVTYEKDGEKLVASSIKATRK